MEWRTAEGASGGPSTAYQRSGALHHVEEEQFAPDGLGIAHRLPECSQRRRRKINGDQDGVPGVTAGKFTVSHNRFIIK
jgi:hypothetical protein